MSSPTPITNKAVQQISAIRIEELNDAQRLAKMPIYEAGLAWLETRRPFLSERSCSDYQKYIRKIADFFGDLPLEQLANPDLIRAYQIERGKGCGPGIINHECSIIQQLLKRIRKWADVAPFYEPIPLPRESPGRALTPDEEKRLLEVGSINPNWATAYRLAIISMNTAAGPGELMGLRLKDVFVDNPDTARIYIRENVKNKFRMREVPLNADALASARALLELAKSRGAGLPDHYLVPFRLNIGLYDPTRPGKFPRVAFFEMCAGAGIKLRPYDLRHHGLTKLAERNPEQVVLKLAGHVSPHMLRRVYAHVRLPALRAAVNSIDSVNRARPVLVKRTNTSAETREQTLFRVAGLAEQLGISSEKALELLLEYERQQALRNEGRNR